MQPIIEEEKVHEEESLLFHGRADLYFQPKEQKEARLFRVQELFNTENKEEIHNPGSYFNKQIVAASPDKLIVSNQTDKSKSSFPSKKSQNAEEEEEKDALSRVKKAQPKYQIIKINHNQLEQPNVVPEDRNVQNEERKEEAKFALPIMRDFEHFDKDVQAKYLIELQIQNIKEMNENISLQQE